jgi:hypothetical protein
MTKTAQTCVTMDDLDFLPDDNIAKYWKEGEDRRECGLSVDDEERDMVYFETVCQIANACSTFVCVCDYDDFVATIDEFLLGFSMTTHVREIKSYSGQLIDMTFYSSRLRKEEVADHTVVTLVQRNTSITA